MCCQDGQKAQAAEGEQDGDRRPGYLVRDRGLRSLPARWLVGRGGRHARGAEQHFPAKVVAMHGAVGLTTFTLVLIAATQATRR
jgi:hypothetical protein